MEGVVQLEEPGLPVRPVGAQIESVDLQVLPVAPHRLAGHAGDGPEDHLLLQHHAAELLHLHDLGVDGGHVGAALGPDHHQVRQPQGDDGLMDGGAAHLHLLGQRLVVENVVGLQFKIQNTGAQLLMRPFPCAV